MRLLPGTGFREPSLRPTRQALGSYRDDKATLADCKVGIVQLPAWTESTVRTVMVKRMGEVIRR
jgi:hypothetical protein